MKLAMGCDPAAYRFYQKLLERMRDEGYDIIDIGCESEQEADGRKICRNSRNCFKQSCEQRMRLWNSYLQEPVREGQWR